MTVKAGRNSYLSEVKFGDTKFHTFSICVPLYGVTDQCECDESVGGSHDRSIIGDNDVIKLTVALCHCCHAVQLANDS